MSNTKPNINSVNSLLSGSGLSYKSQSIIIDNLSGNTQGLLGTTGVGVDDLNEDDVTLFAMVVDQSSSMGRFTTDVIEAYNQDLLEAMRESKLEDSVIMSLWTFNSQVSLIHSYKPLGDVVDLNDTTYVPGGTTALYDAVLNAMTGLAAYAQTLQNSGVTCRGILVVISDGEDNMSVNTASKVETVAKDLLDQEIFNLGFYAFGTEGKPEAAKMGFTSVFETGKTKSEIRRGLGTVSKSIIRASQTKIVSTGGNFFSS